MNTFPDCLSAWVSPQTVRFMRAITSTLICLLTGGLASQAQGVSQHFYGTALGGEGVNSLVSIRAGGYLVVGSQYFTQQQMALTLRRTNAFGDTLWTKRFSIPNFRVAYANYAVENAAGQVLLAGTGSGGATGSDAFMALLNSQGDTLWTKRLVTPVDDEYVSPVATPNGDFFVGHRVNGQAPSHLLRVAPSGQVAFQLPVAYDAAGTPCRLDVLVTDGAGGCWAALFNPLTTKFVHYNSAGMRGAEHAPHSDVWFIDDIRPESDGYLVTGQQQGGTLVMRLDTAFTTVWSHNFCYTCSRAFKAAFARRTCGNTIVVGGTETIGQGSGSVSRPRLAFYQLSPTGQSVGTIPLTNPSIPNPGDETLNGLAADPTTHNIFFAGTASNGPIGGYDAFWGQLQCAALATTQAASTASLSATIHPNPTGADGLLTLRTTQPVRGELRLTTLLGQPLRTWLAAAGPEQAVSLAGLPAGVYLLSFADEQGRRQMLRVVRP